MVYPPKMITNILRKEDTPMNYFKFNQLWADVNDYFTDWKQEAFSGPGPVAP